MHHRTRKVVFAVSFVAPSLLIYSALAIIPVLISAYYSLLRWDGLSPAVLVGLSNLAGLLRTKDFWTVTKNTGIAVVAALLFQIPAGLFLAYLLYRTKRGFKFFRASLFLPVVIASIAIGTMFSTLYNADFGPINALLKLVGLGFLARSWLTDARILLYAVILPQVWQYLGVYVVVFLAAMQSIPESLIESAHIDGAAPAGILFRIVLPCIYDVMQIGIILSVTGALKSFDMPWVLTRGGPGSRSSFLAVLMFRYAFNESNIGDASNLALMILAYGLLFTVLFKRFLSREPVEYS